MFTYPIQAPSGGQILFLDTFTDALNPALSAHTPDINIPGDTWTKVYAGGGDLQIIGGVQLTCPGTDVLYLVDMGLTDFIMTCDFQVGNISNQYIMMKARTTAAVNVGYGCYMRSGEKAHLIQNVTSLDGPTTVTGTVPHTAKMICDGTNIKVYLDDNLELDETVSPESYGTYAGIQMSTTTNTYMDNFQIQAL